MADEFIMVDGNRTGSANVNEPDTALNVLRLGHRIGRGTSGDTYLARLHSKNEDFSNFHEVAVKVLPKQSSSACPAREQAILAQLNSLIEGLRGKPRNVICAPLHAAIANEQIRVIMPLYPKSLGDIMTHQHGERLTMDQFLKYGAAICKSVAVLHAQGRLALDLKPNNFFVDENDQAVIGSFGLPLLLAGDYGADPESSEGAAGEPVLWLGTPTHMAPEQWAPALRGPLCKESDAWGFACAAIEMCTGISPWKGKQAAEIYEAVVLRREKPRLPLGLPVAVERVLQQCLEYDPRKRPSFERMAIAFAKPDSLYSVKDWLVVKPTAGDERRTNRLGVVAQVTGTDSVDLQLCDWGAGNLMPYSGDDIIAIHEPFVAGNTVRLKAEVKSPRFGWCEAAATDSAGRDLGIPREGLIETVQAKSAQLSLQFPSLGAYAAFKNYRTDPSEVELSSGGIAAGDWVRVRRSLPSVEAALLAGRPASLVGLVWKVEKDTTLSVAFSGLGVLQMGVVPGRDVERVEGFTNGQWVRVKRSVEEPKYGWPARGGGEAAGGMKRWWIGRIRSIAPNGLLEVHFPGRLFGGGKTHRADPGEVEVVRFKETHELQEKMEILESYHWGIKPAMIGLSLWVAFKALRVGTVVIKNLASGSGSDGARPPVLVLDEAQTMQKREEEQNGGGKKFGLFGLGGPTPNSSNSSGKEGNGSGNGNSAEGAQGEAPKEKVRDWFLVQM
eukprot:TRINITY_DN34_c0_g1_i1.p1 TRINITY_DN34_c0_g1~~TRINITY_DN34_c0_g1_i1.p1  ORF type:complete len:726 (+),score=140.63 TRINITY_DN34_c0_g1_i1:240-2417(+)